MTQGSVALEGLVLKLLGYQRAEFEIASRQQERVLYAQGLVSVLAAATAFVKDEVWLYILGVTALAFVLIAQFFMWKARAVRGVAEEMRRTVLVHHGLGTQPSISDYADLTGRKWCTDVAATNMQDAKWYATQEPPGYARLADMLEESVSFSQQLLTRSARITWYRFGGLLAVTLFIVFLAVPFSSPGGIMRNVQIACAGLTFLLSAEVIGAALRYGQAAGDARQVASELRRAREANFPANHIILLLTDYNSAVESAPLFVPGLHEKVMGALNSLFSGHGGHGQ